MRASKLSRRVCKTQLALMHINSSARTFVYLEFIHYGDVHGIVKAKASIHINMIREKKQF